MHTKDRIYPAIASLMAMTEAGIDRQEAIDVARAATVATSALSAIAMERFGSAQKAYKLWLFPFISALIAWLCTLI